MTDVSETNDNALNYTNRLKARAVPLHAIKALVGRGV
jgi:hypothetical protein